MASQEQRLPEPSVWMLRLLWVSMGILFTLYFRFQRLFQRETLDQLKGEERPLVVIFNHASHLDTVAVGLCLGVGLMRRIIIPGKKELFESPGMAWLLARVGAIPLDRDVNDMHVVQQLLRALRQGRMVMMAPEGTRTADGAMQPFKPGFVKLAHRSRALVVPVGIRGAYEAMPRGVKFPRPHKLIARVGAPIDLDQRLPARPNAEAYAAVAAEIQEQVRRLCEEG